MNTGQAYALLADGTTVEIRPADPADFDAVKSMHEGMSPDNTYLRFFNLSRLAAETEAQRICRESRPDRVALLALAAGEVVGCASYDAAHVGHDRDRTARRDRLAGQQRGKVGTMVPEEGDSLHCWGPGASGQAESISYPPPEQGTQPEPGPTPEPTPAGQK